MYEFFVRYWHGNEHCITKIGNALERAEAYV